jgi:osmotically-inducible protein OsmY
METTLQLAAHGDGLGGRFASTLSADAKQEQQIQAQFQKAPDLKNNHIKVEIDDGIAVLEGTVDSQREKKEAQQLAHVDGILGVNNRLEVRGAGK